MGVELEELGLEPRGDLELLLLLLLLEEREERDERIGSVHSSPVVFDAFFGRHKTRNLIKTNADPN